MAKPILKQPEPISQLLTMMLGKTIGVKPGPPMPASPTDPLVVALYRDPKGELVGACACDIEGAASMAAALSLFPVNVAKKVIKSREFEPGLWENLEEVFNIGSRWFSLTTQTTVTLETVIQQPPTLPKEVRLLMRKGQHSDFTLTIPGYGPGRLSLYAPA